MQIPKKPDLTLETVQKLETVRKLETVQKLETVRKLETTVQNLPQSLKAATSHSI